MLFLIALQFLTIIPIKRNICVTDELLARSMVFFPVIGLIIGGIQVLVFWVGRTLGFSPSVVALFLILIPIIITGALHIEGFADMIDGFAGGQNKDEILQIMHDSRIGAIGAISVSCLILANFVLLTEVIEKFTPIMVIKVLLIVPCLSRWSMVLSAKISNYASNSGIGRPFTNLVSLKTVLLASIVPITISIVFFSLYGIFIIGIALVIAFIVSRVATRKIGGITGDILGGINELTGIAVLLSVCLMKAG